MTPRFDPHRRVRRGGTVTVGRLKLPIPGETTLGAVAEMLGLEAALRLARDGKLQVEGTHATYRIEFTLLEDPT